MKETRFKDTEIGIIPEDWEVVKLADKGSLLRGSLNPQMFPQKHFVEYSMPSFDNGCIPEVKEGITMQSGRTCIKSPVLLYNKLNVRQRRIWYIETCPDDSICSMEFLPYVSDKIDLCCLKYFVNTNKVTADFVGMSKGTSNSQKRIAPSDFLEYKIGLPKHKEEQSSIASALTSIDNLISSLDKLIEKKKNIKQGTMQQLLTGKKRLKGFSEPWVKSLIKNLYQVTRGYVLAMSKVDDHKSAEFPYPVFSSQTKDNGIAGYYSQYLYENAITWTTDGANAGDVKYRHGKFFCTNVCGVLLSDNGMANLCMAGILGLVSKSHVSYVGNPKLMNNTMANIEIYYPADVKEQIAISEVLIKMDNEILALEAKKSKYESLKQGMMQQLLTGKIRLV